MSSGGARQCDEEIEHGEDHRRQGPDIILVEDGALGLELHPPRRQAEQLDGGLEALGFTWIGAADPDLSPGEAAEIVLRLDAVLHEVVIDHDVVEGGLPRSDLARMKTDAHAARVVNRDGAEQLAVLAAEKDGAPNLDIGGGEVSAEKLRGGLEDERRNHSSVEQENHGEAAQAQIGFGFEVVGADGGSAGEGIERPDDGTEAGDKVRVAVKGKGIDLGGRRRDWGRGHDGGGEDDGVGALDVIGKSAVERGVFGVAVIEVHFKDDALGHITDEAAQDEREIEARPGPWAVGGNVVDGDEGELVGGLEVIGTERLAPVEERFLEGIQRASGELGVNRVKMPQRRAGMTGGEGDAPFPVGVRRLGRDGGTRYRVGGKAKGKVVHGGRCSYAKRDVRRQ